MKRELRIAVTAFLIIFAGILAAGIFYFVYTDFGQTKNNEPSAAADASSEVQRLLETDKEIDFDTSEKEEGKPSEWEFSDDLHKMTHQKVKAQVKWGHLEITDERIESMLATARNTDYKYKDFYIETLSQWQEGDFSNAVKVHNVIWKSQDGSIGIATDHLSAKEEMEYKAKYFD